MTFADRVLEGLYPEASRWATDPAGWVRARLGEHLWSKQVEIAKSVLAHRSTAVKSCHDVGKSFIAARVAAWWLDTHRPGDAFVVSTAPSFPQVRAILWREIGRAHRKGGLPGRVNQTEWHIGAEIVGYGRKPSDYDEHSFQGIHARYVLVILDEACGIPKTLWTAVEAITTGADCRILAIGNPDDPATEFANVCKPGSGWHTISISAFDSPNFTGEAVPDELRHVLLDPDWVEAKKRRWGESSPLYVSKVLGEFPEVSTDGLIPIGQIAAAQERSLEPAGRNVLSVDVARFGDDKTTIYRRQGPVVRLVGEWPKTATTETTGHAKVARIETGAAEIRVDGDGVGGGVVDELAEQGEPVVEMRSGVRAYDPETFLNARAEWYWGLRQRFEDGDIDLDPDDDELASQLAQLKYRYTSRGQVVIESKDDMRKRGVPSPDRADAVMMAFALVVDPPDEGLVEHYDPVVISPY